MFFKAGGCIFKCMCYQAPDRCCRFGAPLASHTSAYRRASLIFAAEACKNYGHGFQNFAVKRLVVSAGQAITLLICCIRTYLVFSGSPSC